MSGEPGAAGDLRTLTRAVSRAIALKASGEAADNAPARNAIDNAQATIARLADAAAAENALAICAAYRTLLDEVDIMEPTGVGEITELLRAAQRSVVLQRGAVVWVKERGDRFLVVTMRLDVGDWGSFEERFDFPPSASPTTL